MIPVSCNPQEAGTGPVESSAVSCLDAAVAGGDGLLVGEAASLSPLRSRHANLALVFPQDVAARMALCGYDVVGWWPLGDLPEKTQ